MTIKQFIRKYTPCKDVVKWGLSTGCKTMREIWERDDLRPDWRIWVATRPGVISDKDLRLFACWCVRQVWHLLTDYRSKNAVEVAEKYAIGEATNKELAAAWDAAWDAARDAVSAAASAARAAASATASAAAWAAASATASAAAWDAAWDAVWDAAWVAALDAASAAQAQKLTEFQVNL